MASSINGKSFITEDGIEVFPGDTCFNYYDLKIGSIEQDRQFDPEDGWFTFKHEDGTKAVLDGSRICSIKFARSKGWL